LLALKSSQKNKNRSPSSPWQKGSDTCGPQIDGTPLTVQKGWPVTDASGDYRQSKVTLKIPTPVQIFSEFSQGWIRECSTRRDERASVRRGA